MRFASKADTRFRIEPLSLTAGIAVRVKPVPPPRRGVGARTGDRCRRGRRSFGRRSRRVFGRGGRRDGRWCLSRGRRRGGWRRRRRSRRCRDGGSGVDGSGVRGAAGHHDHGDHQRDEADDPDAARRDRSDVSLIPAHRDRFEKVRKSAHDTRRSVSSRSPLSLSVVPICDTRIDDRRGTVRRPNHFSKPSAGDPAAAATPL